MKEIDETAAKLDVIKDEPKRRRRRTAETAENAPEMAATVEDEKEPTETPDAPKRRRRSAETADVTPEVEQTEAPARRRRLTREENAVELPFDVPDTTAGVVCEDTEEQEEPTPRRRRRRAAEN